MLVQHQKQQQQQSERWCHLGCLILTTLAVLLSQSCCKVSSQLIMPTPLDILGRHRFYYFESELTAPRVALDVRKTKSEQQVTDYRVYQVREWISWTDKFYLAIKREKETLEASTILSDNNNQQVTIIDGHSNSAYMIRNNDKKCILDKVNKREPYYLGLESKHKTNQTLAKLAQQLGLEQQQQQNDLFSVGGVEAIWLNGLASNKLRYKAEALEEEAKVKEENEKTSNLFQEHVWTYEALTKIVSTRAHGAIGVNNNNVAERQLSDTTAMTTQQTLAKSSTTYGESNRITVAITFLMSTSDNDDHDSGASNKTHSQQVKLKSIELISDKSKSSYKLLSYGGYDKLAGNKDDAIQQTLADTFSMETHKVNINNWMKLCHTASLAVTYPKLSHQMAASGSYHLRYYFVVLETTTTDSIMGGRTNKIASIQMKKKLFVDEYFSSKHQAQLFIVESHKAPTSKHRQDNDGSDNDATIISNNADIKLIYRDLAEREDYLIVDSESSSGECRSFSSSQNNSSYSFWTFNIELALDKAAKQLSQETGENSNNKVDIVHSELKGLGALWLNSENHSQKKQMFVKGPGPIEKVDTIQWTMKISKLDELKFVFEVVDDHAVNSPLALVEFSSQSSHYDTKYEVIEFSTVLDDFNEKTFLRSKELCKSAIATPLDTIVNNNNNNNESNDNNNNESNDRKSVAASSELMYLNYLLDHSMQKELLVLDSAKSTTSDQPNSDRGGSAEGDQLVSEESQWIEDIFPDLFLHLVSTRGYQIYSEIQLMDNMIVSIEEYVSLKSKIALYVYTIHNNEWSVVVDGQSGDHFYLAQDLCQLMGDNFKLHPLLKLMPYQMDDEDIDQATSSATTCSDKRDTQDRWFLHGLGAIWARLVRSEQKDLIRKNDQAQEWRIYDDYDDMLEINVEFKKDAIVSAKHKAINCDATNKSSNTCLLAAAAQLSDIWFPTSINMSPRLASKSSYVPKVTARILKYQPYLDADHLLLELPSKCKTLQQQRDQQQQKQQQQQQRQTNSFKSRSKQKRMPQLAEFLTNLDSAYYAKYTVQGHRIFADSTTISSGGDVGGDFYRRPAATYGQQENTTRQYDKSINGLQNVDEPIEYEEFVSLIKRKSLMRSHVGQRDRVEYFVDGASNCSYYIRSNDCYQVDKIENFIDEMWFKYEMTHTNDTKQHVALMGIGGIWFRANNYNRLSELKYVPAVGPKSKRNSKFEPASSSQFNNSFVGRLHWLSNGDLSGFDQWIFDDVAGGQYSVHLYFEPTILSLDHYLTMNLPLRAIKIVKYGEGLNLAKSTLTIQVQIFRAKPPELDSFDLPKQCDPKSKCSSSHGNSTGGQREDREAGKRASGSGDEKGNMPSFLEYVRALKGIYNIRGEVISRMTQSGQQNQSNSAVYTVDEYGSFMDNKRNSLARIRVDYQVGNFNNKHAITMSTFHDLSNVQYSYQVDRQQSNCIKLIDLEPSYEIFFKLFNINNDLETAAAAAKPQAQAAQSNAEGNNTKTAKISQLSEHLENLLNNQRLSYKSLGFAWLWLYAELTNQKYKVDQEANVVKIDLERQDQTTKVNYNENDDVDALLTHRFNYEEWRLIDTKLKLDYSLYFKKSKSNGLISYKNMPLAMIKIRQASSLGKATVSVFKLMIMDNDNEPDVVYDDITSKLHLPDGHNCNELLPDLSLTMDLLGQSALISKWLFAFQHLLLNVEVSFRQKIYYHDDIDELDNDSRNVITSTQSMSIVKLSNTYDWSLKVVEKRDMTRRGKETMSQERGQFDIMTPQKRVKEIYDFETDRTYQIDPHTGQCITITGQNLEPNTVKLASFDKQTIILVDVDILFGKVGGFKKEADYYSKTKQLQFLEFELKTKLNYNGQPNQPAVIKRTVVRNPSSGQLDTPELGEVVLDYSGVTIFIYAHSDKPSAHIARVDIKLISHDILDETDLVENMLNIEACHTNRKDILTFDIEYPLDTKTIQRLMDTKDHERLIRNSLYSHLMIDGDASPMEILGVDLQMSRSELVASVTMIDMYKPLEFYTLYRGRKLNIDRTESNNFHRKMATDLESCSYYCETLKCDAFTYNSLTHECQLLVNWLATNKPILSDEVTDTDDTMAYVLKTIATTWHANNQYDELSDNNNRRSIFKFHQSHSWRNLEELIQQLDWNINSDIANSDMQEQMQSQILSQKNVKALTLGLALSEVSNLGGEETRTIVYTKLEPVSFRAFNQSSDEYTSLESNSPTVAQQDEYQQKYRIESKSRGPLSLESVMLISLMGLIIGLVVRPVSMLMTFYDFSSF